MPRFLAAFALLALALPASADDKPKPNTLTPKEIADGWILLFDGESTFGWKIDGKAEVKDGKLALGGNQKAATATLASRFAEYEMRLETDGEASLLFDEGSDTSVVVLDVRPAVINVRATINPKKVGTKALALAGADGTVNVNVGVATSGLADVQFQVPETSKLWIKSVKLRPLNSQPLFTGKNLDGWKVNMADPKRVASKWEVAKDGELSVKNGPGDLVSDKEFDNFVLQFECKTLGKALNSGFFFRCIPGQYQNGYEAQIQNAYVGDDRSKPTDFGTGAIYRRVPARKVVSNDNEWFTMTVVADGKHIATWVNGYQTVDWTDDRKENDNPRQGYRAAKGPISIQGHDPTTDILFRNIRVAELGKK